jgi:hypothetical protein
MIMESVVRCKDVKDGGKKNSEQTQILQKLTVKKRAHRLNDKGISLLFAYTFTIQNADRTIGKNSFHLAEGYVLQQLWVDKTRLIFSST